MEEEISKDAELLRLDAKIQDAETNLGDVEVRDAILEKAAYYTHIGLKEKCIDTLNLAYTKTIGIGKKMDIIFQILQIFIADKNLEKIKLYLDKCTKLFEQGGDWERKNKIKVRRARQS